MLLLLIGITAIGPVENQIDGRGTGAPLIEEKLFAGTGQTERRDGLVPGLGMERHGVVEHTVHVDEYGFEVDGGKAVFLQIGVY